MALLALLVGSFFGTFAGLQYIFPDFLKDVLPFNRMRPFHVSSVVGWIILCATGAVYFYITHVLKLKLFSNKLSATHLILFVLSALAIYIGLLIGNMGGREYLVYAPIISLPILLGWLLFAVNYFRTTLKQVKGWPVYLWMWGTGIVFMCYHFTEAHAWLLPYFRENFIKDMSVQWKSYGSFVGSWNMLIYGTAIFLMARIKKDDNVGRGKLAFFFYFLGLTNLMFGWAHHTYIIPTQPWIRAIAYGTSMSEWIILIYMIITWKRSLEKEDKLKNILPYKFLLSTDFWVFCNLFLALLISIPLINIFTHGTHITVAHSMGTTIGINTSILLASALFITGKVNQEALVQYHKRIKLGFYVFNISLLIFWVCLILGGVEKSVWTYFYHDYDNFSTIQESIQPYMIVFLLAGYGILGGLIAIVQPMIKILYAHLTNGKSGEHAHAGNEQGSA